MPPRAEALPIHRKLAFAAAATFLALGLLEAVSWFGGRVHYPPDPLVTDSRDNWLARRAYDPLVFWRMQPRLRNRFGLVTNSLGLRGPEIPAEKGSEFRILSLGESTTYSARMPNASTYSARLERALGRVDGKPVRVINAGVPGYTVFQGWVFLEHRGLDLEPDAVLLYFGWNDYLPIAFREDRDRMAGAVAPGMTDAELFARRRHPIGRLNHALLRGSNFYRLLSSLLSRPSADGGGQVLGTDRGRTRVPESDRLAALQRIHDICESKDIRLVVIVPWYRSFEEHAPLLREFASANELPIVDLPRRLAHLDETRPDYFYDFVHPTEEGHRLIADSIAEVLRATWRVAEARGAQGDGR